MTTLKLIKCQTRWSKFLSKFIIIIGYILGKNNGKADTLKYCLNESLVYNYDNW